MLPNDIARCAGVGDEKDGFREGCEDCARRTDKTPGGESWQVIPPVIIVFECEFRIPPAPTFEV